MVWQSEAVRNWKGERVLKEKKSLLIWERHEENGVERATRWRNNCIGCEKDWKGKKKQRKRKQSLKKKIVKNGWFIDFV